MTVPPSPIGDQVPTRMAQLGEILQRFDNGLADGHELSREQQVKLVKVVRWLLLRIFELDSNPIGEHRTKRSRKHEHSAV